MSERLQSDPATIRAAMGVEGERRSGIIHGLDEAAYHSDPALSSTGARSLLKSAAKFHYERTHPQAGRAAFDVGTAAHTKVLGVGAGVIAYPDEHLTPGGNVSTKAATMAWAEEQRAKGLTPVSPGQIRAVDEMAESVLAKPEARAILESVDGREVSLFADVEGVPSRARFDIYNGVRAGDLKTADDASPAGFNKAVARYGYHIQDRWYGDTHTAITGTELEPFKFIVVEKSAPYLVGVYDLDFMWEDLAKERVKRARDLYRECTESGVWPGYPTATLTPPTWAVYESEEEEIQVS
ncbi:PD-(D/E)XK nuclease-like domain-containing protein [Plantibacter sp. M259]|uniref:PD-(D/E)XK nuclease-like domain-containing protein n=1 Tax=Plantibacter sp. M259 TaxID=2583822 RepID=UPI00143D2E61|nr:PD-(D/E)XK nuclease-like domain-containing protein [Plantibacter sp. M259]